MTGSALPGGGYQEDDPALWRDFRSGDRTAFEVLYQKYIRYLISYGFKISGDRQVVQDCVQDLFIEIWESRKNLAEVNSVKGYLFKSLRYKILRHLKQNSMEELGAAESETDGINSETALLDEEGRIQQSRRLLVALDRLPKRQKEAIHLRYFQEMSNEEVARVMGVNYQSACKFIYTGLRNLKEVLLLPVLLWRMLL